MDIETMRREISYMMGAEPVMMEDKVTKHEFLVRFGETSIWTLREGTLQHSNTLHYEEDYNLLMDCVTLIERLGYTVDITGKLFRISRQIPYYFEEYVEADKKKNIFKAVLQFAITYNEQKRNGKTR